MKIEIDQSGKLENTSRPTVVAYSNHKNGTLVILSAEKKTVQKYFRQIGKPKLYIYLTFIALMFCLVKNHIQKGDQIIIDREYPGYEKFIATKLKQWLKDGSSIKDVTIVTSQIGKKSRAHDLAWQEFQLRSHQIVKKISAKKIIKIIEAKTKSGNV